MNLNHTEQYMQKLMAENYLDTYAVAVGINGHTQLITSANANADTYFDIASLGKVVVTTPLALRAIGEGKLRLNDTLDMFFDGAPEDKKKITIQQLLTHTSGIHEDVIPKSTCDRGTNAVVAHILQYGLDYTPGSQFLYSSQGMILMGYILDQIYHMPLDGAFYAYLAAPMGYTRTRFNIDIEEENAAVCYYRKEAGDNCAADRNVYSMKNCVAGSGGTFSSAGDLRKYAEAILAKDERLYPAAMFDLAEHDYTPDFTEGRGLGYLMVDHRFPDTGELHASTAELFPAGSFGHTGNTGAAIFLNRERNLYAIVLTNATRFAYMKNQYNSYDYEEVRELRSQIHSKIKKDLVEQNLL